MEKNNIKLHGSDIHEPNPIQNTNIAVWDLVLVDIQKREEMGIKKYGMRLQPSFTRQLPTLPRIPNTPIFFIY